MISKFYTLKGSRESRKGRRRKTSDVKTCKKKARKKVREKEYGACLRDQKNKRKEKKIQNKFYTSVDTEPYEENVV